MKPVLADTSYFIALLSEQDAAHGAAVAWAERLLGRTVVSDYVLIELGNALSRSKYLDRYACFVEEVLSDRDTLFVPASLKLFRRGLPLFATRPDKVWSMVDCKSFVILKQRRLTEALTTDQHFEQAGFRALLREGGGP